MIRVLVLFSGLVAAVPAAAETLLATHTVRPQTILGPEDLTVKNVSVPGALTDPIQAIGQEARVVLYAGRPIRPGDIGPPALVDRNQIVTLTFETSGLAITTDGRALARGGAGDRIRVMNLSSRTTITGTVLPDGTISVSSGGY